MDTLNRSFDHLQVAQVTGHRFFAVLLVIWTISEHRFTDLLKAQVTFSIHGEYLKIEILG